jgi:hypothetical protein
MTEPTAPIRKSSLPCIPPPEWEFHTWFPHPDGGGDMVPGERQRGVLVRRRVSYGDWETVRPDRWADEPPTAVSSAGVVQLPPTNQAAAVSPPAVDRAALSAKLWAVAERHIVAEWICCEPLEPRHDLCAKGYAALSMAKTLLVDGDPEEVWNPAAPLLDAVIDLLPAPVDRATVLREEAALIRAHCPDHLDDNSAEGSWMNCHCDVADDMERRAAAEATQVAASPERANESVPSVAADRAAVLREAADGFDRHVAQILDGVGDKAVFVAKALRDRAAVWSEAAETLRRLAAETKPEPVTEDRPIAYRSYGARALYCVICARQEDRCEPVTQVDEKDVCSFCGGNLLAVSSRTLGGVIAKYLEEAP